MTSIGRALRIARRFASRAGSTAVTAGHHRGPRVSRRDLTTVPGGWPKRAAGDSKRRSNEAETTSSADGRENSRTLGVEAVRRWNADTGGGAAGNQGGGRGEKRWTKSPPTPLHSAHYGGGGLLHHRDRSPAEARGPRGHTASETRHDVRSGRRGESGGKARRHAGADPLAARSKPSNSEEGCLARTAPSAPALSTAAAQATSLKLEQASIMRRLKQAKSRRDGDEAKRILEDALAQDDAADLVDVFVYSAAVGVFAKTGRWEAALEVLGIMRERGVRPNDFTYNQAISACGNGGAWSWAVYLLKAMPKAGVPPDVVSYNAAIGACARAGQAEVAVVLLREMLSEEEAGAGAGAGAGRQLAPNALTYNTVLAALAPPTGCGAGGDGAAAAAATSAAASSSHWKLAVGLLEEMREKQMALGAESYAPAVAACVAGGQAGTAVKLLRQMRREDRITPDLESYNAAMAACRRAGEWELAVVLLAEVKDADGVDADGITYAEVVEACRRGGQSEMAADLSKESQEARGAS